MQGVKSASVMGPSRVRGDSTVLTVRGEQAAGFAQGQPSFSWAILLLLLGLLAPLIADQTPFEDPGWKLHTRTIDPRLLQQAGG